MKRLAKEYFNLYIYIIIPLFVVLIYCLLSKYTHSVNVTNTLKDNSPEIPLTFFGILLTLLGLLTALPSSKYDKAMKKYGYFKIIFSALFYGIIATLIHLILFLMGVGYVFQSYLFFVYISETLIATYWVYEITKLIFKG